MGSDNNGGGDTCISDGIEGEGPHYYFPLTLCCNANALNIVPNFLCLNERMSFFKLNIEAPSEIIVANLSVVDSILLVLFQIIKVAILSLVNRKGGYTTTILL